jgi:hypothetical protein
MSWQSVFLLTALSASAWAQQIPLEALEKKFAGKTKETVEVNLDGGLLSIAMKFLKDDDPEQARAKKVLQDVKAIYVRVWTFDGPGEYAEADLDAIRSQLKGWSKVVDVRSARASGENADVYMNLVNDKIQGLVVMAAEGRELTLVNLVGSIDPANLRDLGGTFGIPNLSGIPGVERKAAPKKKNNDDEE